MSASPAVLSSNSDPNPKASHSDWTIVSSSRRRNSRRSFAAKQTLNLTLTLNPSPWAPTDQILDQSRSGNLLRKIKSTIELLKKSQFYRNFLSQLNSDEIHNALSRIRVSDPSSDPNPIQLVAYGIGSFESYPAPKWQLGLIKLLRCQLGAEVVSAEIFDPVLSATECHVAKELGFKVVLTNEHGRRKVTAQNPTIFFMPHCEAELYNSLLETNWRPSDLNRMVVIGNSFSEYSRYVSEYSKLGGGSVRIERVGKYVLEASKFVREIRVESEFGDFFEAFRDMSWHFFDLDDGVDLGVVGN